MTCTKECVYCEEQCVHYEGHPGVCQCDEHLEETPESFKTPKVTITIKVGDIEVTATRPMSADIPHDNEENAARLADQLVRAAVQRHYNK